MVIVLRFCWLTFKVYREIIMKNAFLRMAVVALTLWLGFAAGSANATTSISGWTPVSPNSFSAQYMNDSVAGGSIFNNWFDFSLPASATGSGSSTVIGVTDNGLKLRFTIFDLFEDTLGFIASGPVGPTTFASFMHFTGGLVPGSYHLHVAGKNIDLLSGGAYVGNIVVGAVPEPEMFAMMLAGLGLLGFSARRRNNNT